MQTLPPFMEPPKLVKLDSEGLELVLKNIYDNKSCFSIPDVYELDYFFHEEK